MTGKLHILKHFTMVVTSVAKSSTPVTNMLLLNMVTQVAFQHNLVLQYSYWLCCLLWVSLCCSISPFEVSVHCQLLWGAPIPSSQYVSPYWPSADRNKQKAGYIGRRVLYFNMLSQTRFVTFQTFRRFILLRFS